MNALVPNLHASDQVQLPRPASEGYPWRFLITEDEQSQEIYLVFADASVNSNKFWKATANPTGDLVVEWGRIGYNAQTKTHHCGSLQQAVAKLDRLVAEKKRKGYGKASQDLTGQRNGLQIITRAQELLRAIRTYVWEKDFTNPSYIQTLNEYLSLVPTPLGMKIDPATLYRNVEQVDRQAKMLSKIALKIERQAEASTLSISLKSISRNFWKHLS